MAIFATEGSHVSDLDVGFLAEGVQPAILGLLALLLDEVALDLLAHFGDGLDLGVLASLDLENAVGTLELHDRAYFAGLEIKGDPGEVFVEGVTFDPAPVAAGFLGGLVLGIHLRHAVELRALGDLLANFLGGLLFAAADDIVASREE